MADKTPEFARQLRDASTDKLSEKAVRGMVARVVKVCPIPLAVQLGQVILDYRMAEIREELSRN